MANPETGAVFFFLLFFYRSLGIYRYGRDVEGCPPAKFVECWPSVTRLLKAVEEIKKMDE